VPGEPAPGVLRPHETNAPAILPDSPCPALQESRPWRPLLTLALVLEPTAQTSEDAAHPSTVALFERYITKGPHPEYREFESRLNPSGGGRKRATDPWKFVDDAVTGGGGFSDGAYLFPFAAEVENNTVSAKLKRRRAEADYDRFAEHVCNAPWDYIVSVSDMIERKTTDTLLGEFWASVDGRGTSMLDFLEYPHGQARRYATGWIFMDRPNAKLATEHDNRSPENRPYAYAVPTRCVVDWDFSEDGELSAIAVLEPRPEDTDACPVRVWTKEAWAVWTPVKGKAKTVADYQLTAWGDNEIGMVPAVPVWNDQPDPGRALGQTEMLDVARIAQTVYNIDSEQREIERKCALFLAIPVKNTKDYDGWKVVIGTDSALVYDGDAGEPRLVSPDLTILERLDERRKAKKDAAYEMAHLRALNAGYVQTSSGFHAEVEFAKTERRIARHAAMLEHVEKKLAELFLRYHGIDPEGKFSITYPREFGVRDMQTLIADVEKVLSMNLGETSDKAEISKLLRARHPRKTDEEIAQMVDEAIRSRSSAAKQASAVERVKAMAAQAMPSPRMVQP